MKKILIKWAVIILIPVLFISYMAIRSNNIKKGIKLSEGYAAKLVCYPDGDYDKSIVDGIKERLSLVPAKYLKILYDKQVFIRTINGPITSDSDFSINDIAKQNKDSLEKFTGVFIPQTGSIVVSIDKTYCYSVEVHEVGHAVDYILFNNISQSDEFKSIFSKEGANFLNKSGQEHYIENSAEYFAETFNYYYSSYSTRKYLKDRAPQSYNFLKALENK
ncbi:hypothetical protein HMPREF1982_01381 [Clostridiales bacterium oral taxon 876 str. F0540]|nr:hypothetical protein HMPREF1982_01381 [Clostridiales bacterium oral taxon 876 str. F0540]